MGINDKFREKALRIVVVDHSSSVRQLICDVLRGLGFLQVESFGSLGDAHSYLETEPVDWIITPLYASENLNGLHTIRMIANFTELLGTRVSLLLGEHEDWVIAKAFELGMLSYHKRGTNRDDLQAEFEKFLATMEGSRWNTTKTSMSYLRNYLRSSKQFEDLLSLEKSILELFPAEGENLFCLAEAQLLTGASDKALATLRQVEIICPEKIEEIDAMRAKITSSNPKETANGQTSLQGQNILGLKNVLIIDHDDATRGALRGIMSELGCNDIHEFSDGEAASHWVDGNGEPGLIVMEWRIPKITGPVLIQRIRARGFLNTPIILLSSLIKPADMPLIREFGVANLALKPLEKSRFIKTIVWTIQQDRTPSDLQTLENKFRTLLNAKAIQPAEKLLGQYLSDPAAKSGRKAVFRAELAYAKEQYSEAKDLAIDAVKHAGESIFALNILAKCLMTLRDYGSALKCFQKAQSISPMNLERLVAIAEVQAELGDQVAAKKSLNTANDIDPESQTVKEGLARVAIISGSNSDAQTALASLDSNINLIRYLNNKAVAHAKCGFAMEGLEIYQKTLAAIPKREHELIAVVLYNAALAKIRRADLQGAVADLEKILAGKTTRVRKKSESLRSRLQEALEQGRAFNLPDSDPVNQLSNPSDSPGKASSNSDADTLINSVLALAPGDLCCYLLFKSTAVEGSLLKKAMATPPRFSPRKALQRDESFAGTAGIKVAG